MRNQRFQDAQALREAYAALRESSPRLRIRDAARQLGVSELDLLGLGLGESVTRLKPFRDGLFDALPRLGRVMALTRNDAAVHERKCVYPTVSVEGDFGTAGTDAVELRFALQHWGDAFAVSEESPRGASRSIQFFDVTGEAIHKIHLTPDSDVEAFENLRTEYAAPEQVLPNLEEPWATVPAWTPALPPGTPRSVIVPDLCELLERIARAETPVTVAVGNGFAEQRLSGPIHTIKPMEQWANILDPGFNLHLLGNLVAGIDVFTTGEQETTLAFRAESGETVLIISIAPNADAAEKSRFHDIATALPSSGGTSKE